MYSMNFKTVFDVFLKYKGARGIKELFDTIFSHGIVDELYSGDVSHYKKGDRAIPKWLAERYIGKKDWLIEAIKSVKFTNEEVRQISIELGNKASNDFVILSESESRRLERIQEWTYEEQLDFIADCLILSINYGDKLRPINKTEFAICDLLSKSKLPSVCKHFVGREKDVEELGKLLEGNRVVYVCGESGQGKTELVKKFLTTQENTPIIYFSFSDNWKETIGRRLIAGDLPTEDMEYRFNRHIEILRNLEENDLLVIDGIDIPETKDDTLAELLSELRCKTIVTTRCRHEDACELIVGAMDNGPLEELVRLIYPDSHKYLKDVKKIIKKLHNHTFAVRLAANVLQSETISPSDLLLRLHTEGIRLSLKNLIRHKKYGHPKKKTFYEHIKFLYGLIKLEPQEQDLLRGLWLLPSEGANRRIIMRWYGVDKSNILDDLIEKGYVQHSDNNQIFVPGLTQDIVEKDLSPTGENCAKVIRQLYLTGDPVKFKYSESIEDGQILCKTLERAIDIIDSERVKFDLCMRAYDLSFKYDYYLGIVNALEKMEELSSNSAEKVSLWIRKSSYLSMIGDEHNADLALKTALNMALSNEDRESLTQIVKILYMAAVVFRNRHMYEKAYSLDVMALKLLNRLDCFDVEDIVCTYIALNASIAITCACMGRCEEAEKSLLNAEKCILKLKKPNPQNLISSCVAKMLILICIGDVSGAIEEARIIKGVVQKVYKADMQKQCNVLGQCAHFLKHHFVNADYIIAEWL